MSKSPPFGITLTDSGWAVTLDGTQYAPLMDRVWSSANGAQSQANELNSIWLIGYEDGANMAVGIVNSAGANP